MLLLQIMQATENPFPDQENKEPPPKKAKSQLFSFMEDEDDEAVNVTGKSIVDDEIDCYLKEPCKKIHVDPLRFWEENTETYPRISKLLKKFYPSLLPQQLLKDCSKNISSRMMLS